MFALWYDYQGVSGVDSSGTYSCFDLKKDLYMFVSRCFPCCMSVFFIFIFIYLVGLLQSIENTLTIQQFIFLLWITTRVSFWIYEFCEMKVRAPKNHLLRFMFIISGIGLLFAIDMDSTSSILFTLTIMFLVCDTCLQCCFY